MVETQTQEEIMLNKSIYFNSKEGEYPKISGTLTIKDNYVIDLEIEVVTSNYYAPASNTRENERLYVYIVPGSKIDAKHEYEYIYPSFNDDHENINLKQEFEIGADIEGPEWFEKKWLSTCTDKDWEKNPERCKEHIEFLKDFAQNKLDVETFKKMLKDLLDNMIPTTNDDEELFDNGNKFVANVLQFIKDKIIDKITEVDVDDIN